MGRFIRDEQQAYLLVNREQEGIKVQVKGQRKSKGKLQLLDPSTGEINQVSLPATLPMKANRALMLIPDEDYLKQELLIK